jgi:DNA cross-link repair 1A protein
MKTILDYFKRSNVQTSKKPRLDQDRVCPVCSCTFWMDLADFELHVESCSKGNEPQLSCPICGIVPAEDLNIHVQECIDLLEQSECENRTRGLTSLEGNENLQVLGKSIGKSSNSNGVLQQTGTQGYTDTLSIANTQSKPAPLLRQKVKKTCPWYKWIPRTCFTVDAFQFGDIPNCTMYFLSHFHSDHYMGLSKNFKGLVYCSAITARLVHQELRISMEKLVLLPMNKRIEVENGFVTLLDANHCPGAVIFLFELYFSGDILRILHTGDFRASEQHWNNPLLKCRIDYCFLDTTYCNPSHVFPHQSVILNIVEEIVKRIEHGESLRSLFRDYTTKNVFPRNFQTKKTLYLVGSYKIGKEKVFMTISKVAKTKVYASKKYAVLIRKLAVLKLIEDPEMNKVLTNDPDVAAIQVVAMNELCKESLQQIADDFPQFQQIVAFKPTGWTFNNKLSGKPFEFGIKHLKVNFINNKIVQVPIPYSEHSSFQELKDFVQNLTIGQVVPTVNVSKHQEMKKYFEEWKSVGSSKDP